mgnify:CR=1 FL=1
MRRVTVIAIITAVAAAAVGLHVSSGAEESNGDTSEKKPSELSCIECHRKETPGLVKQYERSRHSEQNVSCQVCHTPTTDANPGFDHYGDDVTSVVTPKRCAMCHRENYKEFQNSRHATAGQVMGSDDAYLGRKVEGMAAAQMGCQKCHGSRVKIGENGKPKAPSWPNSGVGRINPDGSRGSCTACHTRHAFEPQQARRPRTCGRCHMGPDHPDKEIYKESKHGMVYQANKDRMNLDADEWVVGETYSAAPTCATCHMAATPDQESTHNVSSRVWWDLRTPVSTHNENWKKKQKAMTNVCSQCHEDGFVNNFKKQFNSVIHLYNNKYAKPARRVMKKLRKAGKLTEKPFDEKLEWVYFELWHHEGRWARHGAAMQGPDYVQWHGFYKVAKHFYTRFIPQAEKLMPGVTEGLGRGERKSDGAAKKQKKK